MSVYEVIFSAANSCISHQLRYVNTLRRIPWYVTVQVRKVHNLEVEVFPFVVNTDSYSSTFLSNVYGSIKVRCLRRCSSSIFQYLFRCVDIVDVFVEVVVVDTQKIVDVSERFIELKCPESPFIVLIIDSYSYVCAVSTHRNANNLSKNFTSKTDEDVINNLLCSETTHYQPHEDSLIQLLLLLSGDIETCPGPMDRCGSCLKALKKTQSRMSCSQCHVKFHLKCFRSDESGVICNSCLFNNDTQDGAEKDQQQDVHQYDIPELNELISKKGLKILHQNIRGLLANKSIICQILAGFRNIYIFSVSETHLSP